MSQDTQIVHTSRGTMYTRRRQRCQTNAYLSTVRPPVKGVTNPNAKLNDKTAMEIFIAPWRQRIVAAKYGVNPSTVGKIKRKELWKHIHQPVATTQV
jgi:hypothetical protein